MKTMAEEIILHSEFGRDEKGQCCNGCNYRYGYETGRELKRRAAEHIAAILSAAGFGPVQEAKGQALRDAAAIFHGRLPDGTGNGRAYNSYQVADMLNARAAALEAS